MDNLSILAIALSLALDAFSVCVAAGILIKNISLRHYFRLAFHFGLFQFFMPILGYFSGLYIKSLISSFDHWVAFILLAMVGGNMIMGVFKKEKEDEPEVFKDPSKGWTLMALSLATSIDAAAVGLSFAVLNVDILYASSIIGIVCAILSVIGIKIGKKIGEKSGKWIEFAGGVILVLIGLKILIEHIC